MSVLQNVFIQSEIVPAMLKDFGANSLLVAAEKNLGTVLGELVQQGAHVNVSNEVRVSCVMDVVALHVCTYAQAGDYPVHLAFKHNNLEMFTALVKEFNADMNIQNAEGQTVLHMALVGNRLEWTKFILTCDLEVTFCGDKVWSLPFVEL